jgi:hypothetical protein
LHLGGGLAGYTDGIDDTLPPSGFVSIFAADAGSEAGVLGRRNSEGRMAFADKGFPGNPQSFLMTGGDVTVTNPASTTTTNAIETSLLASGIYVVEYAVRFSQTASAQFSAIIEPSFGNTIFQCSHHRRPNGAGSQAISNNNTHSGTTVGVTQQLHWRGWSLLRARNMSKVRLSCQHTAGTYARTIYAEGTVLRAWRIGS